MSYAAIYLLASIARWNAMSPEDRELNIAIAAIVAEKHFQAVDDCAPLYEGWLGLVFSHAPLPLPFVRRGEA